MKFFGDATHFKGIVWSDIIYFTDFFLFFTQSLNQLAKDWLGEEKKDHTDFTKINEHNWEDYVVSEDEYCRTDVELLKKLWDSFEASINKI